MTEAAAEPGRAHRPGARPWERATAAARRIPRLPPPVWDSLLPVLLLLNAATTPAPRQPVQTVALTAALALPLLWRRRAPLAVFGAVVAAALVQWLLDVQLPADIAVLVALYTLAAHSDRRTTLLAGAVVQAGVLLACLRWAPDGAFLTPFVAVTAMTAAAAVLGMNVRTTRAYLAAVEERAAHLEREQEQQARLAVAEERARITREMHDIVTHNLSVMVALADAAGYARQRSPERADTAMRQISETGRQALTDMRRSLGVLRADEPDAERHPLPGIAQLDALAEQMSAAGLPTRLEVRGGHGHLPATAQLTVYRLVQEALTNALKHTPAGTRATVRIGCSAGTVTVDVTDTGPRPSASASAAPSGHGIPGMRERSAAYGGTLRAGPLPGGGWAVRTRLLLDSAGAVSA
ncbi:sensor histidine kinase [Kitasatospora purpeofusca]|uniref:sensor histidine kinase n=1 Tax=Kitasatospora purpeofusca TaxID=67352 RepID=UPI00224CCC8C|nr:histidine kinase [Kitasatospora purpeofusca]MCX4755425.1 histidine kinase [Kitasatospora purpeofusca]WSR36704.1 histidine kinase [Kitasatospora purpeofusca]WSR44986.1 histidine kinase [Kitasatospora purpeofusca]